MKLNIYYCLFREKHQTATSEFDHEGSRVYSRRHHEVFITAPSAKVCKASIQEVYPGAALLKIKIVSVLSAK